MKLRGIGADENGATSVERAILVCVVGLVILVAVARGLSPREALKGIEEIIRSFGGCEEGSGSKSCRDGGNRPAGP